MRHFPLLFCFCMCVRTAVCWYPASCFSLQFGYSPPIGCYSGDLGGAVEGRSGEAVHITMMLQVVEQEEVQQVQIVALLGRVVLPVDRRGR